MVIKNERFKLGQTHHSDLGVQYDSNEFHLLIKTKEILYSMSGKGDYLENAIAESFFDIVNVELIQEKLTIFASKPRRIFLNVS